MMRDFFKDLDEAVRPTGIQFAELEVLYDYETE